MTEPLACACDPELDWGPNNPECPRHGDELKLWAKWEEGLSRCPYCIGQSWENFEGMCDCPQLERERKATASD